MYSPTSSLQSSARFRTQLSILLYISSGSVSLEPGWFRFPRLSPSRSDPVGGEPSVTIEPDVLALGPVEALNVLPLGAKGA